MADIEGMYWVAFHIKYNDEFFGLESGDRKDIFNAVNNRWVYEDQTMELKVGDIIYYWVQITYMNLEYNLINQQYQVTSMYIVDLTTLLMNTWSKMQIFLWK